MPDRWRSGEARQLAAAVRRAGGSIRRAGRGRLNVTGPGGTVTIQEPGGETRRDLRRSGAARLVEERTGLMLSEEAP